ncbi:MAG: M20/M25/M40 family metallo-hydrolase, partial [Pseudomonadales bacterium]
MPLPISLRRFAFYLAATLTLATPMLRAESFDTGAEALVLTLAKETIAMRSVRGPGNQSADVANRFRRALVEGGWPSQEIEVIPFDETAYFIATWPGINRNAGAIIISAHLDVVDADPADWTRDPFTPIIEDGYLFGRGASDTKFDASLALVATLRLRQTGYQPSRDIVIAYSGDE